MNQKVLSLLMLILVASPSFTTIMGATVLTVNTDGEAYDPGEEVEIYGTADPNTNVTIFVNSKIGIVLNITITTDEDGEYETKFLLSSDAPDGVYDLTASTDNTTAHTSFIVTQSYIHIKKKKSEDVVVIDPILWASERAVRLRTAIDRTYATLNRINATAERLEDEGYDVEEIRLNLNEANETLMEAVVLLDLFDIEGAAEKLATAREILDTTMDLLHSTAKEVKEVKAERFLEYMERRILSMNEKINRLRNGVAAGAVVSATAMLQNTERKLQSIRTQLVAGDVADAIEELDDAVEEIEETLGSLNGKGISKQIKSMNKLEAKISILNATAEKLRKRGEDTSEIEEEIQNAEKLIDEAMALLEKGDTNSVGEVLEKVQEQLEETEEASHKKISKKITKNINKLSNKAGELLPNNDTD
jgi:hypothetical protein